MAAASGGRSEKKGRNAQAGKKRERASQELGGRRGEGKRNTKKNAFLVRKSRVRPRSQTKGALLSSSAFFCLLLLLLLLPCCIVGRPDRRIARRSIK